MGPVFIRAFPQGNCNFPLLSFKVRDEDGLYFLHSGEPAPGMTNSESF